MSLPSKPVNIASPRIRPSDAPDVAGTPLGTPDLRALRAQYAGTPPPPNIPHRSTPTRADSPNVALLSVSSTPIPRRGSHGGLSAAAAAQRRSSVTPADLDAVVQDVDDLPEEDKVKVLRRHLVAKHERETPSAPASEVGDSSSSHGEAHAREDTEPFPIPYHAPGADVTHDIYKWQSGQRQNARARATSFAGLPAVAPDPAFEHIHEPGGFRRNYVILRANELGTEEPRMLKNFIDFLYLFGHFAGEDLEEEEEDKDEDEEAAGAEAAATEPAENSPLLGTRSRSRSRRRRGSQGPHGDATVTQAVLMLLKSFVGTGILFLGKAFYNGGLLFSALTISFIALISLYSFLLLVKAKFVVSGSFGDIGGTLYGPWMRYAILSSIVVSQLGFVCAYTIFVAENFQAFVSGITHCIHVISVPYFIALQLIIFLPLALIRDLAKLSTAALVADAFILAGLVYIFGSEISIIAKDGIADVQLFNPRDFPLFIGTAVFSFEGIGLVIPITDSMREPRKFPAVLTGVMLFLLILFGGGGALAYLTFGSSIQTVVLVNLNAESKMVQTVQFLYSLAILLSTPLQLFPAVRIMEHGLFTQSGKVDARVKWQKNAFRAATVLVCSAVAWAGAADLDKFVSFIGSFACVPLCYIYPAMLHYRACARTRRQKAADIALMVFGLIAAVYTTVQTLKLMIEPAPAGPPPFANCDAPGA